MKKIIYSLVIMIAAGSLFTSCVTNTEPQGIKDLREAKADYIESLSNLKKAEAEKVKAEAAIEQAKADYLQAKVDFQKIQNEIEQCKADSAKAKLSVILKDQEAALKRAEADLAQAEFELQQKLNNLAVLSEELTPAERIAIKVYTDAYAEYIEAEQAVRKAESNVYYTDLRYAEIVQQLKIDTAEAAATIAVNQMLLENLPDSGASEAEIKALLAKYDQERVNAEYERANIEKEWNLYRQTEVAENIKGFATELSEWVVKNAALPAPYAVHFKAELPDNDQVNGLFCAYVGNQAGIEIDPKNQAIAANFYSIPSAEEGLEKLNTVVSALSRDLVVDSTKYFGRVDTTGMSAAVADAWEEYNDTEATIKAGVEAFTPVTTAWATLAEKEQALEATEDSTKILKDTLIGTIENLVDAVAAIQGKYSAKTKENLVEAIVAYASARADYFACGATGTYRGKASCRLDSIPLFKYKDGDFVVKEVVAIKDLTADDFFKAHEISSEGKYYTNVFPGKRAEKQDAYKISLDAVLMWLCTSDHADNSHRYVTDNIEFSAEYLAFYAGEKVYVYRDKKFVDPISEYEHPDVAAAKIALGTAKETVEPAYKKFYTDVYGKFWGIVPEYAEEGINRKGVKVPVLKDSLEINFTKETFTKDYPIVSFYYIRPDFYKEGEFNIPTDWKLFWNIQREEELAIVMTQLLANQGWKSDFQLHKLLLTKVLWCQYAADTYSIGAEGTTEALARLQEIEAELFAEVIVAIAKQVENSEPFFAFVENLIGKECLDGIFARIDSAATVAAQFEETTTEPGESWLKMIAKGEITSKALFTLKFEEFMCGSGVDSTYRTAYEHMQIAKAFTGEEFADLVSDVIAAYIQAKDIKLDVEGYDNIIEKILFGTVEKVNLVADKPFENALKIVAPVVGPYFYNSFGGKIAELQDKYFTEWKEAWAQYDVARAAINATLDEINTEVEILRGYAGAVKEIILRAKVYEYKIAKAKAEYEEDCATLAAIEAGANPVVLWKEKVADRLAVANANLAAAADKLAAAEAAYRQVLANHGIAE